MSTTRFGYVPNGKKKKFQDYRRRDVDHHWMMGIFNCLQDYKNMG
jgi:hypothetical protein